MASPMSHHMQPHADHLNPPTIVGDYVVGSEIGRGSFATVYLASRTQVLKNGHNDLQPTPFAVKSVLRDKLNRKLSENLQSEIKILQGLRHPNIVQLLDVVNTDRHIHLIMEYCSLGDLSSFIKRKGVQNSQINVNPGSNYLAGLSGGLAEFVVRHFLNHLVKAMIFLRQNSLIHRDLKPQNLLLSVAPIGSRHIEVNGSMVPALPVLKLADFGFARSLASQDMASTLCGSPLYMAPEVLRGDKYDAKADLWSLGAILYEMIYGRPPFKAQNHIDLLKKIDRGDGTIRFPGEDNGHQVGFDPVSSLTGHTTRNVAPSSNRPNRASPTPAGYHRSSPQPSIGMAVNIVQPSEDLKDLIRQLLKRNPIERMSFEEFFLHPAVQASTPRSLTPTPTSMSMESSGNSETSYHNAQPPFASSSTISSSRDAPSEAPRKGHPSSLPSGFLSTGKAISPTANRTRSKSFANPEGMSYAEVLNHQDNGGSSRNSNERQSHSQSSQQNSRESLTPPSSPRRSYASVAKSPTLDARPLTSAESMLNRNEPLRRSNGSTERESRRRSSAPHVQFMMSNLDPPFPNYAVDPNAFAHMQTNGRDNGASVTSLGSIEMSGGSGEADERDRMVMLVKKPSSSSNSPRTAASSAPTGGFVTHHTHHRHNGHHKSSAALKNSNLDEYVVVEKGAVEVNWLADEVERMVGLGVNQGNNVNNNNGYHHNNSNHRNSNGSTPTSKRRTNENTSPSDGNKTPWAETFKGRPQSQMPESMHRFLDPPVDNGHRTAQSSSLQDHLAMLNRCARRGQAIHQFADERLLVAKNAVIKDSPGSNNSMNGNMKGSSSRAWAEEALALYIRALSLYEQGMTVARAVLSRGAPGVNLGSLSAAVAWIRDRFNECLERAELARKVMESKPDMTPARTVEKMIHDRALDMAETAGVSELNGGDLASCEAAYSHAALLLEGILQEHQGNNNNQDSLPFSMDVQFETISSDDRAAIERFLASLYVQISRIRESSGVKRR
ncbi:hypothetical protein SmJEL517_g02166 [Synchytrium microbalum]|uniref:non-specific serine/threonine protein kinase n=1 Tax=Synchytrium microbalum TaxID=1806994 RepID=A0A507C368_9FUNG|nr:uncharacterized protein SmJEL517_g02166 [Synchytrium microbalum]TPX35577.1 hypothetical protein SmJEL517_g02166 [Synchytrium microbalum]